MGETRARGRDSQRKPQSAVRHGRASSEIQIAASPDEVFAVLSDGARYAEWVVGAKAVDDVDRAFPEPGSSLRPEVGVAPAVADATTTVTSIEPGRRLEMLTTVEPLGQARITFDLRTVARGTTVRLQEEAIGEDVKAGAARRLTPALRARNSETLWRLKMLVEDEAGAGEAIGSSNNSASALPGTVAAATARVFAWLTAVRGERVFHPLGTAFAATARLADNAVGLLGDRPDLEAIVRVSRGAGLPHPLPDVNGVAIRLIDAHGPGHHQDLLLASSSRSPVARHALLAFPFLNWSGYTSITPYRTVDGLRVFGTPWLGAATADRLAKNLPADMRVDSAPLLGAWEPMIDLTLTRRLDRETGDALRFTPWNTGEKLTPAGLVNRLRLPAYAGSQGARQP